MRKNPHVRICGGLGSATTLVYPTLERPEVHIDVPDRVHTPRARPGPDGGCPARPAARVAVTLRDTVAVRCRSGEEHHSTCSRWSPR